MTASWSTPTRSRPSWTPVRIGRTSRPRDADRRIERAQRLGHRVQGAAQPCIRRDIRDQGNLALGLLEIDFAKREASEPGGVAGEEGSIMFTPGEAHGFETDEILFEQLTQETRGGTHRPADPRLGPQATTGDQGEEVGFYVDQDAGFGMRRRTAGERDSGANQGIRSGIEARDLHYYARTGYPHGVDIARVIERRSSRPAAAVQRELGIAASLVDKIIAWWGTYGRGEPSNKTVVAAMIETAGALRPSDAAALEDQSGIDRTTWQLTMDVVASRPSGDWYTSDVRTASDLERYATLSVNTAGKKRGELRRPATLRDTPMSEAPVTFAFRSRPIATDSKQVLGEVQWGFEVWLDADRVARVRNEHARVLEPSFRSLATAEAARSRFYRFWRLERMKVGLAGEIEGKLDRLSAALGARPPGKFPNDRRNRETLTRLRRRYLSGTWEGESLTDRQIENDVSEIDLWLVLWT